MKYLIGILLFATLFCCGCDNEVNIEQPPYKEKIVVDGFIESGRPAYVFLTLSSPYLTNYDSASIVKTFLNYGRVELVCSNGQREVLTLFRYDKFFPPFVYRSVEIMGEVGLTYTLEIKVNNEFITATTTIPEPPKLKGIVYSAESDTTGFIKYAIQPVSAGQIQLFIQVRSVKADKNFHPSYNPNLVLDSKSQDGFWFKALRPGKSTSYWASSDIDYYKGRAPKYQYTKEDSIWVKIGTVDAKSYAVLNSLFFDLYQSNNPFAFNGNKIESNIIGGIGRWTGIGVHPSIMICGETNPNYEP